MDEQSIDICHEHELPCDDNGDCAVCREARPNTELDQKLDRIIELLEAIARGHGYNWQGGPR